MAAAPAMADLLSDILDGADLDHVRCRAACILREIESHRPRDIVARVNGEWEPSGTAFLVSRHGFLLAARHVIEAAAKKRGRMVGPCGKFVDQGRFFALWFDGPHSDQSAAVKSRFLSIERTTLPDRNDIAFCQLRWPPREGSLANYFALRIRPLMPGVGERVSVFGYDKLDLTVVSEDQDQLAVNCAANAIFVRGTVTEVHVPIKDRVLAPFPAFTVEVETDVVGGMSGGPVINEAGCVCGIVSSSRSWERTATCAALTLAMGTRVDLLARQGLEARSSYILEMVRDGLISSDDSWRTIRLKETVNGTEVFQVDEDFKDATEDRDHQEPQR